MLPKQYQTDACQLILKNCGTLPPNVSQDTFNAIHEKLSMVHIRFKFGPLNYRDAWDWLYINKSYLGHLYVHDIRKTLRLPPVTDLDVRPANTGLPGTSNQSPTIGRTNSQPSGTKPDNQRSATEQPRVARTNS